MVLRLVPVSCRSSPNIVPPTIVLDYALQHADCRLLMESQDLAWQRIHQRSLGDNVDRSTSVFADRPRWLDRTMMPYVFITSSCENSWELVQTRTIHQDTLYIGDLESTVYCKQHSDRGVSFPHDHHHRYRTWAVSRVLNSRLKGWSQSLA